MRGEPGTQGRRPLRGEPKPAGHPPRKAPCEIPAPVPETDTGGQGEDPKVRGETPVKELGKMHP